MTFYLFVWKISSSPLGSLALLIVNIINIHAMAYFVFMISITGTALCIHDSVKSICG